MDCASFHNYTGEVNASAKGSESQPTFGTKWPPVTPVVQQEQVRLNWVLLCTINIVHPVFCLSTLQMLVMVFVLMCFPFRWFQLVIINKPLICMSIERILDGQGWRVMQTKMVGPLNAVNNPIL